MDSKRQPLVLVSALLAIGFARAGSCGDEPSSPSFLLRQSSVSTGGGAGSGSAGFRLDSTAGQRGAVGASSSNLYVLRSGFWSFAGTGPVPILLAASGSGDSVSLAWTGNDPPFDVLRSVSCADLSSGWLISQSSKTFLDTAPPTGPLVCYAVRGQTPGSIAPAVDGTAALQLLP